MASKMIKTGSSVQAIPVNFLLGCSDSDLGSFELARRADAANFRRQLHETLDAMIDNLVKATLAGWFRTVDRETLKKAIENPEDVMTWAREQIRGGPVRPRPRLSPELRRKRKSASVRKYMEAKIAQGKCSICTKPLARHSVRYCEDHLAKKRASHKPHGVQGRMPGSLAVLAAANLARSKKARG